MLVNPTATLGVTYTGQYGGGIADNGISARLSTRF